MLKKIAVLFGGCSTEYEVSLESAYAVMTNMNMNKYELLPVGITRTGRWYLYEGPLERIPENTWWGDRSDLKEVVISLDKGANQFIVLDGSLRRLHIDAVFPVLHGKNGEDGTVQGLIELSGIPLIGCGTLASALCMDKVRAHRLVQAEGIAVPRGAVFTESDSEEELFRKAEAIGYPLFVKPVRAGSSFGITKVLNKDRLFEAAKEALKHDSYCVIEECIDGFEVGCAVLGNEALFAGEIDEIELSDGFFDYTEKYTLATSKIHMPARIDKAAAEQIRACGKKIYKILGCSGFARVDMFLKPDGTLIFNEVNTIPGFTSHSRYPNMMRGCGITFEALIDKIIQSGGIE